MKHFAQLTTQRAGQNAIFIVYRALDTPSTEDQFKDLCANFAALIRSLQNRYADDHFSAIIGFGAEAWARFFPAAGRPRELETFAPIEGPKYTAVSTPGDLFFHIRADKMGICYEFASIIDQKLSGVVESVDETHCFGLRDGRAIIGFADGTENPAVDDDFMTYGVIGREDQKFEGGSYIFVQKYIHNMKAWNALSEQEQERVIGRRKYDDVEMSDQVKPPTSHSAVANVGDDLKIVRANMPFANTSRSEYGTYFIGYAGKFSTTQLMLRRMFAGDADGNLDSLLDFSTPVTGTLFFAPSFDLLGKLGD